MHSLAHRANRCGEREEEEEWERRPGAPGGGKGREGTKKLGTPRNPLCEQVIGIALECSTRSVLVSHDSLAEWSKALASGASPQGRGFEPHSCHCSTSAWLAYHMCLE